MTRLIGMFNNKAVIRPGVYVFIRIVEIKCGKKALKIIEPKNPIKAHFNIFALGKLKQRKEIKQESVVIIMTAKWNSFEETGRWNTEPI